MSVSFSELRAKEVIRLCDAECIGCVCDLLIDAEGGCVSALCVMPAAGWGAVLSGERTVIPWDRVRCVGRDTVLVDVRTEECRCAEGGRGWRKRFFGKS